MRRFFSSLRFRLLLLVFLALAPQLALTLYTYWEHRQTEMAAWEQRCVQAAQLAAREEAELIKGTRQLLAALAQLSKVRSRDTAWGNAFLGELLKHHQRYSNLGVVRPNGDAFCAARPMAAFGNATGRQYFQKTLQTRNFSIGVYQIDRVTGRLSINFGCPAFSESGELQAVVFADLDLDWLNRFELTATAQLPAGATWTKIDGHGAILARHPAPEKWIGKSLPEKPLLGFVRTQKGGLAETLDPDGVPSLYGFTSMYSPLFGGKVAFLLGIPKRVLFAKANRALVRNLTWLGIELAIAMVIGWIGSDLFILRRIKTLVKSTARLAAGDLCTRTGLHPGVSELDQLGQAFDQMAGTLEHREAERQRTERTLRECEARFRRLAENAPAMIYRLSLLDGRYEYVGPASLDLSGYSPEEFYDSPTLFRKIIHPDWQDYYQKQWFLLLKGETPPLYEFQIDHKSGETKWVYQRNTLIRDETGLPIAVEGIVIDITERRRAEEKLRESEIRYRVLAENSAVGIWHVERKGETIYLNPAMFTMLEIQSVDELAGRPYFSFFTAESLARMKVEEAKRPQGVVSSYEVEMVGARGGRRHVFITGAPLFDAQGNLESLIGTLIDISEQKRLESRKAALSSLGQRLGLATTQREALWIVAEVAGTLFNWDLCRLDFYVPETDQVQPFIHLELEDGLRMERRYQGPAAAPTRMMRQILTKGGQLLAKAETFGLSPFLDLELDRSHGTLMCVPVRHGHKVMGILSVQSATLNVYNQEDLATLQSLADLCGSVLERIRAQEALQESEQRFRSLFENSPVGIAIARKGVIRQANQAYLRMFGYEAIAGVPLLDQIAPTYREEIGELFQAREAGKVLSSSYETMGQRQDGSCFPFYVEVARIGLPEGLATVSFITDITARKLAEEALRELPGRLLQLQDEERRRIARELHDSTAQWLAALDMNLTMLNTAATEFNPKAMKLLSDSLKIVGKCSQEVRTLSYLLHPPLLDELGLLGAMEEYAVGFAKRSGIRVNLDLPSDAGRLPKEIELAVFRILQEGLANVHRHSGSSTATVRLVKEVAEVRLEVTDTGHGMDLPTSEGANGGTPRRVGVGIAGMRERLRQLGGRLEIDSNNHGTTIRASVPYHSDNV